MTLLEPFPGLKSLNLRRKQEVAVACSGGADSMALTLLAHKWAQKNSLTLVALTVDHGLRAESAREAKQVGAWLKKRRIAHHILRWEGKKPKSNLQEAAREARYRLMARYCHEKNIRHLFVAHTLDDQAETFLLRLARGSGVDGLAAMQPQTERDGITLLRPLLGVPRAELLAYLKQQKQPFITDPSNDNDAFDRVRMRKAMPQLAKLGLSAARLAATAQNMGRAREALTLAAEGYLARHCEFSPLGYALLVPAHAPEEIALRALARILMQCGGQMVRPRLDELVRLHMAMLDKAFTAATLHGCILRRHREGFLICREPRHIAPPQKIAPRETFRWDNRFDVKCGAKAGFIGALTQEGWLSVAGQCKTLHLPRKEIAYSLPTFRDEGGKILAVPHLGIGKGLSAQSFIYGL